MVQVPIGWCSQLEGAEADVIKGLVINLINILYQLMDREGGVAGPNSSVGHLG